MELKIPSCSHCPKEVREKCLRDLGACNMHTLYARASDEHSEYADMTLEWYQNYPDASALRAEAGVP